MDEDNLKWVANKKKYIVVFKQFHENVRSNPIGVGNKVILQRCKMML